MFDYFHIANSDTTIFIPLLLLLGWCVGVLSAFFGVGGGWIITPALNLLGMSMTHAVGTGISFLFGTSIASMSRHRKSNNVEWGLAPVGLGILAGLELGKQFIIKVVGEGHAESLIRIIYIILLVALGSLIVNHSLFGKNKKPIVQKGDGHRLHGPEWRPIITLHRCQQRVSLWYLLAVGLGVGVLSGMIGVGGGFVLVPIFTYGMGVPVVVAIGTSLMCISFGGFYGTLSFAMAGRVEYSTVGVLLLGALLGIPVGVAACRIVHAESLRLLFGIMLLLGGFSIIISALGYARLAPVVIFTATAAMVAVILIMTAFTIKRQRQERFNKLDQRQD